jgi:hypothetical protein
MSGIVSVTMTLQHMLNEWRVNAAECEQVPILKAAWLQYKTLYDGQVSYK